MKCKKIVVFFIFYSEVIVMLILFKLSCLVCFDYIVVCEWLLVKFFGVNNFRFVLVISFVGYGKIMFVL